MNGRFYRARVSGVQRFARHVSDLLYDAADVTLFLPANVRTPREARNAVKEVRGRLSGHAWEQLELPWQARTERCDLVLHLAGTAPGWGGPHAVVIYDVTPLTNPEWFTTMFTLWYRWALRRAAKRANRVLTISRWSRSQVSQVLGIPADGIDVVTQGVEPFAAPAQPEAVNWVRKRFGISGEYLLAIGGAGGRKNVRFLLEMMRRWPRRRCERPCLVVVGEHVPHVHRKRHDIPPVTNGDVRFLGYVSDADLHALYTGAAVFCFPSLAEGFGRPPLEAMACGSPTVVANYGAAEEVLGEAARILPLNVDAWIEAVTQLINDSRERSQRIAAGHRQAKRYDWYRAAEDVIQACRKAVGA